jgi:hypothetical protein
MRESINSGFVVHLELKRVKIKAVIAKRTKDKEIKKP